MAPENGREGVLSTKSEVYSFGVLLLEIVTAIRRNSNNQTLSVPSLAIYVSSHKVSLKFQFIIISRFQQNFPFGNLIKKP